MSAYHVAMFSGPIAPDLNGCILYGLAVAVALTVAILLKVVR